MKCKQCGKQLAEGDRERIEERSDQLNSLQTALKISLNAIFSVTIVPYSRYFNPNIAVELFLVCVLMFGGFSISYAKPPLPENVTERVVGWLWAGYPKILEIGDRVSIFDENENLLEGQLLKIHHSIIKKIYGEKYVKVEICIADEGEYCCAIPIPEAKPNKLSKHDELYFWYYNEFGQTYDYYPTKP